MRFCRPAISARNAGQSAVEEGIGEDLSIRRKPIGDGISELMPPGSAIVS